MGVFRLLGVRVVCGAFRLVEAFFCFWRRVEQRRSDGIAAFEVVSSQKLSAIDPIR